MIHHYPKREAFLAAFFVFLVTMLCNVAVTSVARNGMVSLVQDELRDTARTAALVTDGDTHKTLIHAEQQGSAEYLSILDRYRQFLKGNPDLRFVYTNVIKDNKIYFVIDSQYGEDQTKTSADPDLKRSSPAGVMEEYQSPTPALKKALAEHVAIAESEWGTFFSAYAPFYDAQHQFVGTVGVDINVSEFKRLMNHVWMAFGVGTLLACGVSMMVYVLVYRIRKEHANEHMRRQSRLVAMQDFNHQIQKISGELSRVVKTIDTMAGEIMLMALESAKNTDAARDVIRGASSRIQSISLVCDQLVDTAAILESNAATSQRSTSEAVEQLTSIDTASGHLSAAATNITNIVGMITAITDKIDLLALNATIEAARAGEAGKSFAVVADEVKILSQQTANATKKISEYVAEMQQASQIVVYAFRGITEKVSAVSKQSLTSTDAIVSQKELIHLVAEDIGGVMASTTQVEATVHTVSSIANQTEMQTQQLYVAVNVLGKQNQELNNSVTAFLDRINALRSDVS